MTVEEAFDIQVALGKIEFPQTFGVSIFFALFKVSEGVMLRLPGDRTWAPLR